MSPTIKQARDVVIVVDRSGSMNGARIDGARSGLELFLFDLRPTDTTSLMTFSEALDPPSPIGPPASQIPRVKGMFAAGGTALYDAVLAGQHIGAQHAKTDRTHIHAVVVLTDGEDRDSKISYEELLKKIEREPTLPLRERAALSKTEKLRVVVRSWLSSG